MLERITTAMSSPLHPLIIAVDDESDDIFFLRRTIGKVGLPHQFQPYTNGEAAIMALTEFGSGAITTHFPLVCFLDIKMIGISGFDILKWIRTQQGLDALPVIMYSSSDHPEDVDLARELGAQAYVKKYPSAPAMRILLEEARDFGMTVPPKKTFLQWHYRFVDAGDTASVSGRGVLSPTPNAPVGGV